MDVSFSKKVSIPDDVLVRELEGESVLLNLENENYYGLDEVGTRMWDILTTSSSIQAAYETLLSEYDTSPDVLKKDLSQLVEDLMAQGLLNLSDG